MSGLSDTAKMLSPAYGLYKSMKSDGPSAAMGMANPVGMAVTPAIDLYNKQKNKAQAKPKTTIAGGY